MRRRLIATAALVLSGFLPLEGARAAEPAASSGVSDETAVASAVLGRLDQAWDALDGARFAAEFSSDADVININGSHFSGRPDVARQMQFIFDSRFKGSRHKARRLELVRRLSPELILVVSSAAIAVPNAADARSRQTFLLQQEEGAWRIRHWHNTPLRDVREGAPTRSGQGG